MRSHGAHVVSELTLMISHTRPMSPSATAEQNSRYQSVMRRKLVLFDTTWSPVHSPLKPSFTLLPAPSSAPLWTSRVTSDSTCVDSVSYEISSTGSLVSRSRAPGTKTKRRPLISTVLALITGSTRFLRSIADANSHILHATSIWTV